MNIRFALAIAFCVVAFSAFAQEPADQMEVVVPAHDVARGAVLTEGDLTTKSIAVTCIIFHLFLTAYAKRMIETVELNAMKLENLLSRRQAGETSAMDYEKAG